MNTENFVLTEPLMERLDPIEDTVIRMLHGMPYKPRTLEFVSKIFDVTRERVRQIEEASLNRIRRTKRFRIMKNKLMDYVE